MIRSLFRVLMVLWAGSLWSLAAWVAPTLFKAQPDRHLAGTLAARLFTIETYLGLAVTLLGLLLPGRSRLVGVYVAAALLALSQWTLKPTMEAARLHGASLGLGFGAWHGIAAVIYLGACAAVLLTVWKQDLR